MYPWELEKFAKTYLDDFIMITPVDHHSSWRQSRLTYEKKKEIEKKMTSKCRERSASNYCDVGVNSVEIRRQG